LGARRAACLVATFLATGCASVPEPSIEEPWTRIVQGSSGERVSRATLTAALRDADYILLGEVHDNAIHHRLQWVVLHEMAPRPLVMEQFDIEAQPALDAAIASGSSADALATAGRLDKRAWNWDLYRPLVQISLDRGIPVVAGNLGRAEARAISGEGFSRLPDAKGLAIETVWNESRERALVQEIVDAHCGQLAAPAAASLARAQRARDAVMADRMLRHPRAVLIAGSGHARIDRGVPLYLRHRAPNAKVVSLAFVEGTDDADGAKAYDFVWITEAQPRDDPCAGVRINAPSVSLAPLTAPRISSAR